MRGQFKNTVMELAPGDDSIVLILGDVSVYLFKDFSDKYEDRFYNMGICENTLVSVGAGMAARGLTPFVHTIAPFVTERSFEQIKLDMCYNRLGVNIVSCGATFDYAWDGATHHAYTDLAILRQLPGMEVLQPGSEKEVDQLVRQCYNNGNPTYFRLSDNPHNIDLPVKFGKGVEITNKKAPLTVVTAGPILGNVSEAIADLDVNLLYFNTISPIDRDLIEKYQGTTFLVIHDASGLWEAVNEIQGLSVYYHGYFREFMGSYGTVHDIRRELGLDVEGIRSAVSERLKTIL
jgi:transketolase